MGCCGQTVKAIGLLSGGLDSTLATKLMLDQGIQVEALKFTSPFCNCDQGGHCFSASAAEELGIPLVTIPKGEDYLDVVRAPKHGYGSGMNPCIDCRIYMLRKAREYADAHGASFVFTGEVLGQRPMSQHRAALDMVERESGLEGRLLRPLSAQYLSETDAEKNGAVDRTKLLGFTGRTRKPQFALAESFGIKSFACPAGGCLLTDANFAHKLKDHLSHSDSLTIKDILLLKKGRHFRVDGVKIVVGRNEKENAALASSAGSGILLEPVDQNGPTACIPGLNIDDTMVRLAASISSAYFDGDSAEVLIRVSGQGNDGTLSVARKDKNDFAQYLVQGAQ